MKTKQHEILRDELGEIEVLRRKAARLSLLNADMQETISLHTEMLDDLGSGMKGANDSLTAYAQLLRQSRALIGRRTGLSILGTVAIAGLLLYILFH